jgi:hypothetical protein
VHDAAVTPRESKEAAVSSSERPSTSFIARYSSTETPLRTAVDEFIAPTIPLRAPVRQTPVRVTSTPRNGPRTAKTMAP